MDSNFCCFCNEDKDEQEFVHRRQAIQNAKTAKEDKYSRYYSHAILRSYDWEKEQKLRSLETRNQVEKRKVIDKGKRANQSFSNLNQRLVVLKRNYDIQETQFKKVVSIIHQYFPPC